MSTCLRAHNQLGIANVFTFKRTNWNVFVALHHLKLIHLITRLTCLKAFDRWKQTNWNAFDGPLPSKDKYFDPIEISLMNFSSSFCSFSSICVCSVVWGSTWRDIFTDWCQSYVINHSIYGYLRVQTNIFFFWLMPWIPYKILCINIMARIA